MSEWLQQLGKRSINAADISDQNYEELERLEHDGVKQVNDANDAFIQDLQSQVSADVQFYQAWFGNKFQQYKDLGPLSTQIANVTNKALEMEKSRREFDYAEQYLSQGAAELKADKSQYAQSINDFEEGNYLVHKTTNELHVYSKQLENFNPTKFRRVKPEIKELLNTFNDSLKDKRTAKTHINTVVPAYLEAMEHKLWPVEINGKIVAMTADQAKNSNMVAYRHIIKGQLSMLLMHIKDNNPEFSDGFIRARITKPMYDLMQLKMGESNTALGKALSTSQEKLFNDNFYEGINSGTPGIIQGTINAQYDSAGGSTSWGVSRQQVSGRVLAGIKSGDIKKPGIRNAGNEWIIPHGARPRNKGETDDAYYKAVGAQRFKTMYPKEYQSWVSEALKYQTNEFNKTNQAFESKKSGIVNRAVLAVEEKGGINEAREDILDAIKEFETFAGGYYPIDDKLLSYAKQLENPINPGLLQNMMSNLTSNHIPVPDELLNQLPTAAMRNKWKEINNGLMPEGWSALPRAVGMDKVEKINSREVSTYRERQNIYNTADALFKEAYRISMKETANDPNLKNDLKGRQDLATKQGMAAVVKGFDDAIEKYPYYFINQGTPSRKEDALREASQVFVNNIRSGNWTVDTMTSNELLDPTEKVLLLQGIQYLNGELGKYPPMEWVRIGKALGVNPHDLITARLEATGKLPKGIKPDYSNEGANLYPSSYGTNYRISVLSKDGDGSFFDFAQVLDRVAVNKDKGGYNFAEFNGKAIETEIPIDQMSVGQIMELANTYGFSDQFKLGMYNINGHDLWRIHQSLIKYDVNVTDYNRLFNQDIQDEFIFYVWRGKLDQNKALLGTSDQSWAHTLNISVDLAKELQDIYPFLVNVPWMNVRNLIPEAIPVLQETLSGR